MKYWNEKFDNPIQSSSRLLDSAGQYRLGNILDYIDIRAFSIKTGLSLAQGNPLLALIKAICIRHSSRITIPTDMRSINAAISNSRQDKLTCLEVIISYPVDLLVDENLLPVKAYYLNPRF